MVRATVSTPRLPHFLMIYDTLSNSSCYSALGSRFELAMAYLRKFDPATGDGRVPLDGENVFALVQSYVPTPASMRPYESHRIFADIQFIAAGSEVIQYSPLARLSETSAYADSKDAALYSGPDDFPLFMVPGSFAILLPGDGHKPGCLWKTADTVKKVVAKIRL